MAQIHERDSTHAKTIEAKQWKQSRCCNFNPCPGAYMRLEMHLKNIDIYADCTNAMQAVVAFVCTPDSFMVVFQLYMWRIHAHRVKVDLMAQSPIRSSRDLHRSSPSAGEHHRASAANTPNEQKRQHKSMSMCNMTSSQSNEAFLTNCTRTKTQKKHERTIPLRIYPEERCCGFSSFQIIPCRERGRLPTPYFGLNKSVASSLDAGRCCIPARG